MADALCRPVVPILLNDIALGAIVTSNGGCVLMLLSDHPSNTGSSFFANVDFGYDFIDWR